MANLLGNLRDLARRVLDVWRGLFYAFVRDNKVLPPVVALLALFLFAWVVAGAFVDEQDGDNADEANLVPSGSQENAAPLSPESEDRDSDSFAAYRNKDPFRQLLAPAPVPDETPGESTDDTTDDATEETTADPDTTTGSGGRRGGNGGGNDDGNDDGARRSRADSDGDGITNRREGRLGLDPRNPDTDGDGTQDADDDSDGDGVRDGQPGGGDTGGGDTGGGDTGGQSGGGGAGGSGGSGAGSGGVGGGNDDDLLDSGGTPGRR